MGGEPGTQLKVGFKPLQRERCSHSLSNIYFVREEKLDSKQKNSHRAQQASSTKEQNVKLDYSVLTNRSINKQIEGTWNSFIDNVNVSLEKHQNSKRHADYKTQSKFGILTRS